MVVYYLVDSTLSRKHFRRTLSYTSKSYINEAKSEMYIHSIHTVHELNLLTFVWHYVPNVEPSFY